MAGANEYRSQVDLKRVEQIRQICRELPEACTDFLRHIAVITGSFTRLAYALDLRTFFGFLHTERVRFSKKDPTEYTDEDLAGVTSRDLIAYTEYLGYYYRDIESASKDNDAVPAQRLLMNHELAIKRKMSSIRSFYDYLFQSERIPSNVTLLVPLPKIHEKPILRLSSEEVQRMLHQAETADGMNGRQKAYLKNTSKRDVAILMLLLGTGIRVSECVGINMSDVDFAEHAFLVTRKGGNQMVLYFPPEVSDALQAYLEDRKKVETLPGHEDAFFLSLQRRRMTERAIQNLVKKYAKIAAPLKPRISPHKLRSTFATNLYQETGDIYLVADVLGHSSVDTTRKHYADMTDERRRKAAGHVHLPEPNLVNDTHVAPLTEVGHAFDDLVFHNNGLVDVFLSITL